MKKLRYWVGTRLFRLAVRIIVLHESDAPRLRKSGEAYHVGNRWFSYTIQHCACQACMDGAR